MDGCNVRKAMKENSNSFVIKVFVMDVLTVRYTYYLILLSVEQVLLLL